MKNPPTAESITAFALGQRRGFLLGVLFGAGLVLYTSRYTITRRSQTPSQLPPPPIFR